MSSSLQTYIVGTVTFLRVSRGLLNGIPRYQLSAAVSVPGCCIASISASANSGADRDAMNPDIARLLSSNRSGIHGSWKKSMYQDASACRLVATAFRNAAGCGTDNAVRVCRRSGNR